MIAESALLLVASIRGGTGPEPDVNGLLQKWRTQCATAPASPDCEQLRTQLERALFFDLTRLYLAGETLERPVLRVAARAGQPELAAFALRRLADAPRAEDAGLALEGLDSPFPAVRSAAAELAQGLEQGHLKLLANRVSHRPAARSTGLIAETVPDAKSLGAAPYPGARFRPAASQPGMAVFSTADAPDRVLAFYAKGRKTFTATELQALRKDKPSRDDGQELAQRMMAELMKGRDPQQVAQEIGQAEQARQTDWGKGIEGEAGIAAPRYAVLEEAGRGVPVRVVAVYRDEALGGTAIAFRSMPRTPGQAAPRTHQDVAYMAALYELMSRPD